MKSQAHMAITALLVTVLIMATVPARASDVLVSRRSVSFKAALKIAEAALQEAASRKCAGAVVVVDDKAIPLVVLRQDEASEQFITGATRKAWTSVNLRASTRDLFKSIEQGEQDDSLLPHIEHALFLMGGVPLLVGETIVGAVGVAACPDGLGDDAIARAGATAFRNLVADK